MRNLLVTLCYTNLEVIEQGIKNCLETVGMKPDKYILVDHRYPKGGYDQTRGILALAERAAKDFGIEVDVVRPVKNYGGHGGFTWLCQQLDIQEGDVVLGVDPDCNILTHGWGAKAVEVLRTDPSLGCVSLLHEHIIPHNEAHFVRELCCGTMLGFLPHKPEMMNVTIWNGGFLKKAGGLLGSLPYYGAVETPMKVKAIDLGYRMGYMLDYRETMHTVAHDPEYNEWKGLHVATLVGAGYKGNFDEFLKDRAEGKV